MLTKRETENPFGWRENENAISQRLLGKQLREKLCRGIWRSWTYHSNMYWNSIFSSTDWYPEPPPRAFPHINEKESPFCPHAHMCKFLHIACRTHHILQFSSYSASKGEHHHCSYPNTPTPHVTFELLMLFAFILLKQLITQWEPSLPQTAYYLNRKKQNRDIKPFGQVAEKMKINKLQKWVIYS